MDSQRTEYINECMRIASGLRGAPIESFREACTWQWQANIEFQKKKQEVAFSRGEKMWYVDARWLNRFGICMRRNAEDGFMRPESVFNMCVRHAGEEVSGELERGAPTDVRVGDGDEASPAPEDSTPVNPHPVAILITIEVA